MAASAALSLWLGRDTTFSSDEIRLFDTSANLDLETAFQPFNGHLYVTSRLAYAAILNAFGAGYLPFRLLTIATVLTTAGIFFVFAKRRIGPVAALAPTLVLLFYGAGARHVLLGNGFTVLLALAAGLGALLALDRGDLKGDLCACLLLCLGLATYSVALPFLAGAAVLILTGSDRWRRAWVFLLPGALYAAWLLWSRNQAGNTGDYTHLSNLLLAPTWAFNSLAAVGSSLLGLNYPQLGSGWGPVVAVAALVALGWRLWRGNIPRWLWVTMTVPAALWLVAAAAALSSPNRVPQNSEYMFPTTIAVLLVAVEAARGLRLQRRGMIILYAAAAIGMATNIAILRDTARGYHTFAHVSRGAMTAAEIVGPQRSSELPTTSVTLSAITGQSAITGRLDANVANYFNAVRRFGSPGFSLASLRTRNEPAREAVDSIIAEALGLQLRPSSAPTTPCRSIKGRPGRAVSFELPPGGVVLKASGESGPLTLRRFGSSFTVQAGQLTRGQWMALSVPSDSAPDPWYAAATAPIVVCPLTA